MLYHINYNIVSEDFDGFIKDIKESYTLKDGTTLNLNLLNATYSGNGELIAPNQITSNIDIVNLEIQNAKTKINFTLSDLSSSSSFESSSRYISSADLKNFKLVVDATSDKLFLNATGIKVKLSSNTQGSKAELNAKSSLESLSIKSDKIDAVMKNFAYDIALNSLDKDSFEEFRVTLSNIKASSYADMQKEIEKSLVKLLSHGLNLNIAKLSLENITLNKTENLEGFDIKSKLKIKEDKDLATKIATSPLLVSKNVEMSINLKLSKALYVKLTNDVPMASVADSYAKEDADSVLFDFTFINDELKVNGKALR